MDISKLLYKKPHSDKRKLEEDWGSLTWLANQDILDTKGVSVARVIIKKGMSNPKHRHPNCEEVLYLLKGKLEHTVENDTIVVDIGDSLLIEANVAHNAYNIGDTDADMIVVYSSPVRQFVKD